MLINNSNIHTHNGYRQQPNRTIIAVLVKLINLNQAERDFVNGCHHCNFLGKKRPIYSFQNMCPERCVSCDQGAAIDKFVSFFLMVSGIGHRD